MRRVRVYRPTKGLNQEDALLRLLEEAGCEVEVARPDEEAEDEQEPEAVEQEVEVEAEEEPPVLIVCLSPEVCEDPDLPGRIDAAERDGCVVIGIWPPGSDGKAPPGFDLADDTVSWDPASVRDAVGSSAPLAQKPDGTPAPRRDGPHLKC